jgi:hypothetical protein
MYRWLYCLNWHIKDILDEARVQQSNELFERAAELTKLKNNVLCKLITEGHAKIDKKHIIYGKTYYCIRITDKFSFHSAELEQVEEAVKIYEQKKKSPEKNKNVAETEETGDIQLLQS